MKTVAGLFDTYEDAEQAVNEIRGLGIAREQISVAARDTVLRERIIGTEDSPVAGAGAGAVGGTAVGGLLGLLVGVTAITVPGIGPVITTGTLVTALGSTAAGAGVGAVTGSVVGALSTASIPEADAQVYAESVRRGSILITVEADDEMATLVLEAMDRSNAVNVAARREELYSTGWERFDETRMP